MKILIISYDELNTRPSREQVLSDIRQIYDNTDEKVKEDFGSKLRREITEVITDTKTAEIIFADTTTPSSRNHLESFVQEQAPDLIISTHPFSTQMCSSLKKHNRMKF